MMMSRYLKLPLNRQDLWVHQNQRTKRPWISWESNYYQVPTSWQTYIKRSDKLMKHSYNKYHAVQRPNMKSIVSWDNRRDDIWGTYQNQILARDGFLLV